MTPSNKPLIWLCARTSRYLGITSVLMYVVLFAFSSSHSHFPLGHRNPHCQIRHTVYTLICEFDPARTVAIVLDVGTNNRAFFEDLLYIST